MHWKDLLHFFRRQTFEVFHHDSPGVRVFVKRGPIRRALFPRDFSTEGERFHTLRRGDRFTPLRSVRGK